jgi:hypothetical protein
MSNVLVIKLGQSDPTSVMPFNGVPWEDGLRSVLSVRRIVAKVQTTVLFGDSLYMLWNNASQMTAQDSFNFFLKGYFNRPETWAQLSHPPIAAVPALYRMPIQVPPPTPPIAQGSITALSSGFDPLYGFWIEFLGNYFLTFPLFKDFPGVIRDGPDYRGFQPSSGNPKKG